MKRRTRFHNIAMAAAVLLSCALPAQADYTVRVDPSDRRGTWEGFGASLAWWAHGVGRSSFEATYTNLFFSTDAVQFMGETVPGLGLNVARFNVGGGGLPTDNIGGVVERRPSILPWYKDIDGYWSNWYAQDPNSASWDWTRDASQRSVLGTLARNGVTVEFFSNAPMWWMTEERSSAGGKLQAWNRRDHARYLATVVQQARTRWGVRANSISPFNEPLAGWWNYPVQQEGANIPIDAQAEVLGYLREELNARGLADVTITSSDENTMTQAQAGYQGLLARNVTVNNRSVSAASLVGKVNVHGYNGLEPWRDDGARRSLRSTVGDKRMWMSEYGDGDGSGVSLAQSIVADINQLRATGWMYWQPLEPYSAWGLVNGKYDAPADETSTSRGQPLWMYTKYHIFAQFTRFLRPGFRLIGSSDGNSVIAHDAANRKLALITLNNGPAQTITYDLGRLGAVRATTATVVTSSFDGKLRMAPGTATLNGRTLSVNTAANSVHSIELTGVDLGAKANEIRSVATGQCVDVLFAGTEAGNPLVQYDCADVNHQRWLPVAAASGFHTLRASHTGQCMNVNGASTAAGAALIQWPCSGTTNEQFNLRLQGTGYALVARHSGLCVGLENGQTVRDTRLVQQTCTGAANQTWHLPLNSSTLQSAGSYLCVDMAGGSVQPGTEAMQWECVGSTNQQWRQRPAGNDVELVSNHSGLCLGVAGSSQAAGAPVVQWNCLNIADQRFQRRPQGAGFALVARHSGMCLAPEDNSQVWGTRIVQQPCNGSDNQTWR